jgi:hypothetical protein
LTTASVKSFETEWKTSQFNEYLGELIKEFWLILIEFVQTITAKKTSKIRRINEKEKVVFVFNHGDITNC